MVIWDQYLKQRSQVSRLPLNSPVVCRRQTVPQVRAVLGAAVGRSHVPVPWSNAISDVEAVHVTQEVVHTQVDVVGVIDDKVDHHKLSGKRSSNKGKH